MKIFTEHSSVDAAQSCESATVECVKFYGKLLMNTNAQSKRCERASKKDKQLDEYLAVTGKTDGGNR